MLDALDKQTLPRAQFETVIVDDGSAEPLSLPDNWTSFGHVRVIRHARSRGPAAARNTGWRATHAPVIAFTDDDCRPDPTWLSALLGAISDDWVIVQGKTVPDPLHAPAGSLSRTLSVNGPTNFYETANIAYPRPLLEMVGGFDETYRKPCGEDVDLGWRAKKVGARLVFAEDAVVNHAVTDPPLSKILRHTTFWTDGVRVLKAHPELRESLVAQVFWKPTHPRLLVLLAGFAVAAKWRRLEIALLGAIPYLVFYRRSYIGASRPWATVAASVPRHFAIDLCELATMIVGSIRHRTLML